MTKGKMRIGSMFLSMALSVGILCASVFQASAASLSDIKSDVMPKIGAGSYGVVYDVPAGTTFGEFTRYITNDFGWTDATDWKRPNGGGFSDYGELVMTGMTFMHISKVSTFRVAVRGDLNDDGVVSVSDVNTLRQLILSGNYDGAHLYAGDLNGDGTLSVTDVTLLQKLILAS